MSCIKTDLKIEELKNRLKSKIYLESKFIDMNNETFKLEKFGGVDYQYTGDIMSACSGQLRVLKGDILHLKKQIINLGGDPF